MKKIYTSVLFIFLSFHTFASYLFIPMDESQHNHLKAYGRVYEVIADDTEVHWLLNYQGGSFLFTYKKAYEDSLKTRNIRYKLISDTEAERILKTVADPDSETDVVKLETVPKIAVYSPKSKMPWDDAVTLVLTYAEIPYTTIFDDEVLNEGLPKYDWLHLHHEDFTGQYGKFYSAAANELWYKNQKRDYEALAKKHGFKKVSQLKLAVVKKIRDFCAGGGFLFAMCSATDTYDIALAAEGVDICEYMYDGDPADYNAQKKLNFDNTFAFKDFTLRMNPLEYEYSNIDNQDYERGGLRETNDYFSLYKFSAKWDLVPTMLTQCHTAVIKGFMGQTTGFKKKLIKSDVVVMGENKSIGEAKYIHGTYGKGTWTFYGGHDPEDYQHLVGEAPTELDLYPNSPGYRLILNNVLFPASKKKKLKT